MFYVIEKGKEFTTLDDYKYVYSVQYKNGYPFFTFYEDGQWITKSAKHFKPV